MSTTIVVTTLTQLTCAACGVLFGLEAGHEQQLRKSHEMFYCPNGHSQWFAGETEVERRARVAEARAKSLESSVEWERNRADRNAREVNIQTHRARALKGHVTRIKRRVAHGVCPCCQRTFSNLAAHMETKHPKYGTAPAAESQS